MISSSLLCVCVFVFGINQFLTVEAQNSRWKTSQSRARNSTARTARGILAPAPIDCRLKSWTDWTSCAPSKEATYRFRYLEQASQFGGTICPSGQWQDRACPASTKTYTCANGFACVETGRCVSERLRCNWDLDCRDGSDEDDCEEDSVVDGPCTHLFHIPGAESATRGYNILTNEFVLPTLDPKYYGGVCEYVYNGEWRKLVYDAFCENMYYNDDEKYYRKPFNFHYYRFMGQAESVSSTESYEDAVSLLRARKNEGSFNLGFTVGINTFEGGVSGSNEHMFLKNISEYQEKNLQFVRLVSKVQTAQFKMRSSGLMLHEDMYQSLVELPEQYDFGAYSKFLSQYGTHYVTSGIMGGSLEYVLVLDQSAMAKKGITSEQAGWCLGISLGMDMSSSNLKIKPKYCEKTGEYSEENDKSSSYVKDVLKLIKGGNEGPLGGLTVVRDEKTYTSWGDSLKYQPVIIQFETLPIYELVRFSTVAEPLKEKVAHLQRAYREYLQEFNSCRCAPCMNNGQVVLSGTSCSCLCKMGYQGVACEETEREGPTHGSWSCWSPWSTCQSNKKTRQRQCNNPQPLNSGDPCFGKATQTHSC
ncbi:hypothetical protein AGOR_G00184290 [Albula goreensis]|uniref:MACPF domain-containing protein n=1 Tax=Albula goreensis TaxID=1534307 RepID=A0A8T3CVP0_9TELE|nr:hypothetical protein AGOR_G00184290 [Albula goreensis]